MDGNNMNNQSAEYTYAAEGTYEAPATGGSNALAIIALICGILSLVCCACYGAGILPGIVGIILGVLGMKKCPKAGMAKVGMILSIVGIVLGIIMLIVTIISGGAMYAGLMDSYYYY